MLGASANIQSKTLGRIDAVVRPTDLTQDRRPFCSVPFWAGPKTHELKKLEI